MYHNLITYSSEISRKQIYKYWLELAFLVVSIAPMPFIKLDISVKSLGIIRPGDEKTELSTSVNTVLIVSILRKVIQSIKEM
jgi:hypothetical protein